MFEACARVVSGTQTGVDGHPSASDSQPNPAHAWEMLGSYWFSRTHPWQMCVSLSHKILTDWTFSWMGRVLNHKIWPESVAKWNTMNLIFSQIFNQQFTYKTNLICGILFLFFCLWFCFLTAYSRQLVVHRVVHYVCAVVCVCALHQFGIAS